MVVYCCIVAHAGNVVSQTRCSVCVEVSVCVYVCACACVCMCTCVRACVRACVCVVLFNAKCYHIRHFTCFPMVLARQNQALVFSLSLCCGSLQDCLG